MNLSMRSAVASSLFTRNETYSLTSVDFQSPTFYGEHANGSVKCLNYKLTHYYRANFFAKKFMFTSRLTDIDVLGVGVSECFRLLKRLYVQPIEEVSRAKTYCNYYIYINIH